MRAYSLCSGVVLALATVAASLFAASLAHAESVVWSYNVPDKLITTGAAGPRKSWTTYFRKPSVSITYGASMWEVDASGNKIRQFSANEQVPAGTQVLFEFQPHASTDISWYATGNVHGTPYGDWVADAALPGPGTGPNSVICVDKNKYESVSEAKQKNIRLYAELSVAPPTKQVTISGSGVSCAAAGNSYDKLCTLIEPGSVSALFTFDPTFGYFYGGYLSNHTYVRTTCDWLGIPIEKTVGSGFDSEVLLKNRSIYQLPIPTKSIPFTLTVVEPAGAPPSIPSLSVAGGASCVVGTPHTISMSATDPDGDSVRYLVDWDADGTPDQIVPPSGYVASGEAQTASRTYATAGAKTVQVKAEDEGGLASSWATLTFSCTEAPPPAGQCSDNIDNDGDGFIDSLDPDCAATAGLSEFGTPPPPPLGPAAVVLDLRLIPSLVRTGNTTRVHWSAQNVQSCTVTAPNGDSWSGISSSLGGETSSPITQASTYTLSCRDKDNNTHTKQATVRILPTFQER